MCEKFDHKNDQYTTRDNKQKLQTKVFIYFSSGVEKMFSAKVIIGISFFKVSK